MDSSSTAQNDVTDVRENASVELEVSDEGKLRKNSQSESADSEKRDSSPQGNEKESADHKNNNEGEKDDDVGVIQIIRTDTTTWETALKNGSDLELLKSDIKCISRICGGICMWANTKVNSEQGLI